MRGVLLVALCAASVFGAEATGNFFRPADETKDQRRLGEVGPTDRIFPHFAIGGGEWETIMVLVNLTDRQISFNQEFRATDGSPLSVTFRTIPEGNLSTTSRISGQLAPHGSINALLVGSGGDPVRTGWASLDYDTTSGRIGAYMIFRRRFSGAAYEALVPLSPTDDYKFYLPIDNLEGFNTAIAIANSAPSTTRVRMTFIDKNGNTVDRSEITLDPLGQTSFVISDRFPTVAGRIGTLYVEGSTDRLSAIGLRFNPQGAFASVPILNWPGMFP